MKKRICLLVFLLYILNGFSQDGMDQYLLLDAQNANKAASRRDETRARIQQTKEAANRKEETRARIQQTKEIYRSARDYPTSISNGWHKVIISDNYTLCDESKVYVNSNQIDKLFISNTFERSVSFTGPIRDAKAVVKVIESDGKESNYLDVYFLEDIINPNAVSSPPQKPGQVCFYSTLKWGGNVTICFQGGGNKDLNSYFTSQPSCGQIGTATFMCKAGEYRYSGFNSNRKWDGTVRVYEDRCVFICLGK